MSLRDWCRDRQDAMVADLGMLVAHESPSSDKRPLDAAVTARG